MSPGGEHGAERLDGAEEAEEANRVVVVALVRDLMDRSRFGELTRSGVDVRFVASAAAIAPALAAADPPESQEPPEPPASLDPLDPLESVDPAVSEGLSTAIEPPVTGVAPALVVVVDLSRSDALEGIEASVAAGAWVVAYGSHVDRGRLDAARAAGAEVLARSAFFTRLPDLLSP